MTTPTKAENPSADPYEPGKYLYAVGDADTRAWFKRQWSIWPSRADERLTTNLRLHYGGVLAYRAEQGCDPPMSSDFASHVAQLDLLAQRSKTNG